MKNKFKFVIIVMIGLLFIGCGNFTDVSEINGEHIPNHVAHIEFWNGGTCIGNYDNASVKLVVANTVHRQANIAKEDTKVTFYKYVIKCNGVEEVIIDSEALAIKYRE